MDGVSTEIDRHLAERVRTLRSSAGITLDQLADRSGVSRAMLSRIERGESSPTAHLLSRVCAGLGINLSSLFGALEAAASPLRRRADQPTWKDPGSGYVRRIVAPPGTGSPTEIVEVTFPAGASVALENLHLAGVDQHVWILDGAMEMTVGEEKHRLKTGDCLHMTLDHPVRFRNPTRRAARYAVILSRTASGR